MNIRVYYLSGNVADISPTQLTSGEEYLVADDFLDVTHLDSIGLILERAAHTFKDEKRVLVRKEHMALIPTKELENVALVMLDNMVLLQRNPHTNQFESHLLQEVLNSLDKENE